jgi:predicted DNA-binding transcriptional regulator AlpA
MPKKVEEQIQDDIRYGRKRLLPIEEAAAYLGLSPRTLYNGAGRRAKNPFPVKPKRIGRKLLWDIRELDAYVDGLG